MKRKRRYDYMFALIRIDPLRPPAWNKRARAILRRLARQAVRMEIINACSGNRFSADDIAKELIP